LLHFKIIILLCQATNNLILRQMSFQMLACLIVQLKVPTDTPTLDLSFDKLEKIATDADNNNNRELNPINNNQTEVIQFPPRLILKRKVIQVYYLTRAI
jgi:hypothetical protein